MSKVYYGGQAVIEGVMMRGKTHLATAVRRPGGEIAVNLEALPALYTGWARKAPLVRGIVVLVESLILGIKTLMYSANVALEEEEEQVSGSMMWLTMAAGMVVAVALFFLGPMFLTRTFHIGSSILFNIVEGLVRVGIFILYLWGVGQIKDIRRTFEYHGAEHKTVNAYEHEIPLETASVQRYSTAHVRCGTSFLFVVLVIAIICFAVVGRPALWLMVLSRIILIPVIVAVSYEVIYYAGRHVNNPVVRGILAPGLWLQSLSTREPDDSQVEVAIKALKTVIISEEQPAMSPPAPESAGPLTAG